MYKFGLPVFTEVEDALQRDLNTIVPEPGNLGHRPLQLKKWTLGLVPISLLQNSPQGPVHAELHGDSDWGRSTGSKHSPHTTPQDNPVLVYVREYTNCCRPDVTQSTAHSYTVKFMAVDDFHGEMRRIKIP